MRSTTLFGVLTPFLFGTLVSSAVVDPASRTKPKGLVDAATFAKTKFDFIVAGGGTAGVALAVR